MRKHARRMGTGLLMRVRRFQVIGVVVAVLVFAIAATAISMQAGKGENANVEQGSRGAGDNSRANSQALPPGQDGQTHGQAFTQSQIRPLTQEEAQQLAEGIRNLVNQSTDGLTQVQHADGSVSMDLQGRFQNVALAKKDDDGNVVQSCVDNRESAAAFLGIDRELIDGTKKASPSKTRQPARQAQPEIPGKGQNQ